MSNVAAKEDLRSASGKLLIAARGRAGEALLNYPAYPENYGKVPIRWKGRRKIYWHLLVDLIFIEPPIDPSAYVALPPNDLMASPKMPMAPDPRLYDFGQNLRQFRKECGWQQWQLVDELEQLHVKVSQTTISYWERNKMAPKGRFIVALARVFRIPAFAFFLNFHDCDYLEQVYKYMKTVFIMHCRKAPV
ncbi:hypothetical protein LCGC14_0400080 [marine sediment metagenome]|uniref:HTH cro/C1-type domain-containing protein n=1 Tax=marine sediment metagenome TaxID=412755 RepID=A0A0F9VJ52_9ZZZZ